MSQNSNDELLKKTELIVKLLYLQVRPQIESLKERFLKTQKHMKAYDALNGERTINENAKISSYSVRALKGILPEWEKNGLILSLGIGPNKKYVNIENLKI